MAVIPSSIVGRNVSLRRNDKVAAMQALVPEGRLIYDEQGRGVYAGDAFGAISALPLAVVLPASVREVSNVLRYCFEIGLGVCLRGGGTSLTGAAVSGEDAIVLCLSRMARVHDVDVDSRLVRVEAGATNADVSQAAAVHGMRFVPDPDSAAVSTVGGNIATNAGGPRALRYGPTGAHVLALKVVLIDGEVVEIGGGELDASSFDLVGLMLGSEGLLGVIVEATLRVLPRPEATHLVVLGFDSVVAAINCASAIEATGLSPSAIELFDRQVARVCEAFSGAGLPQTAEAVLLVEVEGYASELVEKSAVVRKAVQKFAPTEHRDISDPDEISRLWQACRSAFTALGRVDAVRCIDIAVPPSRLADAMVGVGEIAARHGLRGANMCRAAHGIIRSVFLYDADNQDEQHRIAVAFGDIARLVVELDGDLAGEHGIGLAKRAVLGYQLGQSDLALQERLKSAFDPQWLLGDGKVFEAPIQTPELAPG